MLILKRFVTKIDFFFHVRIKETDFEHLQKWKKLNIRSIVWSCFTEDLITSLSTTESEAPASRRTFVTSVQSHLADRCRGVRP
jgi:hypothetical protein